MAGNANKVIFGNFLVYYAPHDASNALPADTVDYGADWGAPWVEAGFTQDGIRFQVNVDRGDIRVDQSVDSIAKPLTSRDIVLESQIAEFTPGNVQLATGLGTTESVAPSTGVRGHDDLVFTEAHTDSYNSWGYDIEQPNGEALRIAVWKGLAGSNVNAQFNRATAAQTGLQITAMLDTDTDPNRIAIVRSVVPAAA